MADRAALEAQWAEEQATIAAAADQRIQSIYGGFQIPDGLGGNSTTMMTPVMMLQLVPTIPTDPAAAPDPATVVSGIMDQVILAAAPQVHAAGLDLWRGLAAILIVWTGLRIAFTGDFRPWDIVRVVIALWFPWAMLTFYHDPLPGSTRSFTEAITDGGQWLQLVLIQNTGEDFLVTFSQLSQNLFARAQSMELGTGGGIMDMLINGLTDLSYLLMSFIHTIIFELFLLFILLCLVVIYGVSMAQVLWAQLALGRPADPRAALHSFPPGRAPRIPVLGMVQEHVHLHPLWRDSGGADAGVPCGEYRLDECHCEWSTARHKHALA